MAGTPVFLLIPPYRQKTIEWQAFSVSAAMKLQLPSHFDPLGEALHSLHMSGVMYTRCDFTSSWGLALPALDEFLMFHIVTSGEGWLEIDGEEASCLQAGDLVLVPHGDGHRLVSTPGLAAAPLFDLPRTAISERYEHLVLGGGGQPTTMICGAVHFQHPSARSLIQLLPQLIHIKSVDMQQAEWVQTTLRFIAAEASSLQPGGETVITRLADILVIQAIRWWITRDPMAKTGWLGALRDEQIGRALALMHRHPMKDWTVDSLAAQVAMSRSAFATRFTSLVGLPPMKYLAQARMNLAATLLQQRGERVADVATRLGYESEAAFSRAFRRLLGVAPGALRKSAG